MRMLQIESFVLDRDDQESRKTSFSGSFHEVEAKTKNFLSPKSNCTTPSQAALGGYPPMVTTQDLWPLLVGENAQRLADADKCS